MHHRTARRLALILIAAAATTACGPVEVSPLAGASNSDASPMTSTIASPSTSASTTTAAPDPAPTSAAPSRSGSCVGSTFIIDGADSADSPRSLCFTTGGVLRIENVYPGDVSADPSDRAACQWEAGIATCRFLRAGDVTVRISGQSPNRSIAVVVV
jgi:hypothetical protein